MSKTLRRIFDTFLILLSVPIYWVYGVWTTVLYFVQHVLIFSIHKTIDNLWFTWKKP